MSSLASTAPPNKRRTGADLLIRLRQNIGLITAVGLFCVVYLFYHLIHPKGFSSAVLVQNADEIFTLAMLAMAQTVPVLAAGLDLSVGALMTMVGCFASYLLSGAPEQGIAARLSISARLTSVLRRPSRRNDRAVCRHGHLSC